MAIDFKLPEVGENIDQADVGNVLVKEGDVITSAADEIELRTAITQILQRSRTKEVIDYLLRIAIV